VSGGVRVFYVSASGREVTRAYWFSGDFIGGPHVFGEMPHMWTAMATRETALLSLSCGKLLNLCRDIPNLAIGLIEALSFKGRCYSAAAQLLGTRTPGERLVEVLTLLAERFAPASKTSQAVMVRITHEELAHMVCVTRQWVTTELRRLEDLGVVNLGRGALHISIDALAASVSASGA
jgi:CRP-like cAMP-binding protein